MSSSEDEISSELAEIDLNRGQRSDGAAVNAIRGEAGDDVAVESPMARWLDDITIQTHVQREADGTGSIIGTTGGHVWDAAKRLVTYFETERHEAGLARPGVKIIELGAGCGYLGMTLARNMSADATVMMTEMETGGALDHLEFNVALNTDKFVADVSTAALDWAVHGADGFADAADHTHDPVYATDWDLVIGSDLVYDENGVHMLPRVLAALVRPGNTAFYCHTKHRYDCLDFDFFAEIAKCGLLLEEVRAKGVPTPSPSPPPFEHLFNEFRIAVYKITKLPS